jgi:hypothetical protein
LKSLLAKREVKEVIKAAVAHFVSVENMESSIQGFATQLVEVIYTEYKQYIDYDTAVAKLNEFIQFVLKDYHQFITGRTEQRRSRSSSVKEVYTQPELTD